MATITPQSNPTNSPGTLIKWEGAATGDTINSFLANGYERVAATVQISGTFGGATAKLQASLDGTNWFDMTDMQGNAVSATSASMFEVTTKALYLRPSISGGTSDSIDVLVMV